MQYMGDPQSRPLQKLPSQGPKVIDAAHIFKPPHRANRPDHFVIILRGLPGNLSVSYFSPFSIRV